MLWEYKGLSKSGRDQMALLGLSVSSQTYQRWRKEAMHQYDTTLSTSISNNNAIACFDNFSHIYNRPQLAKDIKSFNYVSCNFTVLGLSIPKTHISSPFVIDTKTSTYSICPSNYS
jgi:hypothetical protein